MTIFFGICGILGGLLTCTADILLDLKGKDNVKSGKYGLIDSAWKRMDIRRFSLSIFLAAIGCPLLFLGFTAMAGELIKGNVIYGKTFWYLSMAACTGGGFIHTVICLMPVIYITMDRFSLAENAEEVLNAVYKAIAVPFWIFYLLLTLVSAGMVIYALFADLLNLSPAYALLTFPALELFGLCLDKLKHDWFCDLPRIIMPTFSIGIMGFLAIMNCI